MPNTNFELWINKIAATVHSKLSQRSKVRNIAQHSTQGGGGGG